MNLPIFLFSLLFAWCARPMGSRRGDASEGLAVALADASVPASIAPAAGSALYGAVPPAPDGESHRTSLANLQGAPILRPFLGALRAHFASARGPFAMQRIGLAGGRIALLVSSASDADGIVLAIDRDQLLWTKERPTAGIVPPFVHLAIAPRPDGGVVLFGYVAPMHLVAARMWADDGNAYAEIELATMDACDALSAAWASRLGWIVACTSRSGTRAQRLREDGTTAWGLDGAAVGSASAVGPATIAFDAPATWLLVQRAKGAGADHLLGWRYDAQARPLWSSFVDVCPLAPSGVPIGAQRFEATAGNDGGVRVELPRGLAGKAARAATIASNGDVQIDP